MTQSESKLDPDLLLAHSLALVGWQFVETNIFFIFAYLIRSQHGGAMSAAYHSVINLNTRLEMIDSAAHIILEGNPLLDEWNRLLKKIKKRARRRNDLAHFGISMLSDKTKTPGKNVLVSSIFDPRESKVREYDIKQINEIYHSFILLKDDLDAFLQKLSKVVPPPSLGKSSESLNE